MKSFWRKLKAFLSESWEEMERAGVATAMWVEGYTDFEIEEELSKEKYASKQQQNQS